MTSKDKKPNKDTEDFGGFDFVPYEGATRSRQLYDASKFRNVIKAALDIMESKGLPAVATSWAKVGPMIGAYNKIHSFTARKGEKRFKDGDKELSIRDIEAEMGVLIGGNREKGLLVIRKR